MIKSILNCLVLNFQIKKVRLIGVNTMLESSSFVLSLTFEIVKFQRQILTTFNH